MAAEVDAAADGVADAAVTVEDAGAVEAVDAVVAVAAAA